MPKGPTAQKRNALIGATVAVGALAAMLAVSGWVRLTYLPHDKAVWTLLLAVAAGVGGIWLFFSAQGMHRALAAVEGGDGGGMPAEMMQAAPGMAQYASDPEIMRLCMAAYNYSDTLVPIEEEFSRDSDGALEGFGFRSNRVGFFSTERTRSGVNDTLVAVAGGAGWKVGFDTTNDTVTATRKSSIPKLALPEVWPVVRSAEEANTAYNEWELVLGPGVDGMVTVPMQVFPHIAAIATTGGGKSVAIRAMIEQFRAIGGRVILGDGKGSDYASYVGEPGVMAVGRGSGEKAMEYFAAIEMAFRIMQQRQATAADRKRNDPEGWKNVPPVFLVLDELKSVLKKWKSDLPSKDFKVVESRVNQILSLGRELRVHCVMASQDARAESILPSWLSNVGMKLSLGKPENMTINKAFDDEVRGEAARVAAGIDPKVRGRGMIAGIDEDGNSLVVEYQGFLGYSPGEAKPGFLDGEQSAKWDRFRREVSEAVPRLSSRRWFRLDEPSEAQAKREAKSGELGYIDIEQFTPDEIAALPIVNLDMRDEAGNIVPDPEMRKYDPMDDEYTGKPVASAASALPEDI